MRRGLWLFVFGLVIGFGPRAYYMHGAMEDVQPAFLKNVTLWFGCPWTLSVYVTQLGSLAMVLFGLCYLVSARSTTTAVSAGERLALAPCFFGTIAEFVAGYLFYFVVNSIWSNFYFTPSMEESTSGSACRKYVLPFASQEPLSRQKESDALWILP